VNDLRVNEGRRGGRGIDVGSSEEAEGERERVRENNVEAEGDGKDGG
jgi:hypothetical protein